MESSIKFSHVLYWSEIQYENNLQNKPFHCKTAKHFMLIVSNNLNKIQNFQKEGPGRFIHIAYL